MVEGRDSLCYAPATDFSGREATMAKGYQANKDRQEEIASLGKALAKRAGFACEWCGDKEDLRPWEYRPDGVVAEENLALLCRRCRDAAAGRKFDPQELRSLTSALWSSIPAVAEGAARVLARTGQTWARDAIEESLIDDAVKRDILP
jgi:hypothetical protein